MTFILLIVPNGIYFCLDFLVRQHVCIVAGACLYKAGNRITMALNYPSHAARELHYQSYLYLQ